MGGFVSKWFFTVSRLVLKKEILDRDFFPDFPMLSMCFRGPQSLVETVGALPAQCGRSKPEFHQTVVERGSKWSNRTHSSRLKTQNARNDHLESSGQFGRRPASWWWRLGLEVLNVVVRNPTLAQQWPKSSKRTHDSRLKPQSTRNDHLESSGQLGRNPHLALGSLNRQNSFPVASMWNFHSTKKNLWRNGFKIVFWSICVKDHRQPTFLTRLFAILRFWTVRAKLRAA